MTHDTIEEVVIRECNKGSSREFFARNLHERWLRLIYNDKTSSYEEWLTKDGSVFVHHRNIRALKTKTSKIKNGTSSFT